MDLSQSVQLLSRVQFFVTPWIAARQASLSITTFWSLLRLRFIESVMPSNYLILCRPLLLPPSIFPSLRVFHSEWALCIRWPKYWCFSFSISPSKEYSELISFPFSWLYLSESHCYRPFSALASDPSGGVWGHFPSVAASLSSVPSCLSPGLTSAV